MKSIGTTPFQAHRTLNHSTIAVILLVMFLFVEDRAYAQNSQCNCLQNLDTLISKTETDYAGFPIKVTAQNLKQYKSLRDDLRNKAASTKENKPCFFVMRSYVKFFYDSHFSLNYTNENDFDSESIPLSIEVFKKQINKKDKYSLEGIWIDQDSSLVLGIRRYANNIFKAIVLESKDSKIPHGLVYMTITPRDRGLTVKYYNTFSSTDYPIKVKGNLLLGWNNRIFGRTFPKQMDDLEKSEMKTWKNGNNGLHFEKLSSKTALLRIPTFGNNDEKISQLIQKNDSVIRSTPNLIIDLTGNGGGSTGWVSFLSYLMTKPIVQENGYVRVSKENVQLKLKDIEPYVVNPIPAGYEKYFPSSVLNQYKTAYKELPITKEEFYPVPGVVFPLDSITSNPKKIALVVDNLCGSSTEYFFYVSKSSGKTTTYGLNTFGMMDYEGASSTLLPCSHFRVSIPIVKSSWTDRHPIDKVGFTPDVLLQNTSPERWIDEIRTRLEK
ncbi:S41 family peptidase [Chryseolinea sp. T2]|uniref:S41 family peptidase n=1 Tax=Chryseolinea sp. T2 TaxID=3129255 RepID=UPI003078612C